MVPTKESHTSTSIEFSESILWKIFFIKSVVCDDFSLNFAYNWENIWFSVIVSVGTYSQVNFSWVFIVLEACCERQNGICWSHFDMCELIIQEG